MLKIKLFLFLGVIAFLLMQCALPGEIPSNYLRNPGKVDSMSLGCWILVNQDMAARTGERGGIGGELIAVQNDTFKILTRTGIVNMPSMGIKSATLYVFKNQSGKFITATALGLLPNVAGVAIHAEVGFLALGIPYFFLGTVFSILNNEKYSDNKLIYPGKNQLNDFKPFARFPQGIPPGVKPEELTLRIQK